MGKKRMNLLTRIRKSFITKVLALQLALFMVFEIAWPTCALALTGGPTQPEVGGFQPVSTSDMVDLYSGDFKYNIPLLDMDGYPINLAYSSGIGMDQEASWVGLGWSLTPGVINRSMRGIPDDFKGERIVKEYNVKPNRTFSVDGGATLELFGFDEHSFAAPFSGTLSYNLGIRYNTYYGLGIESSIGVNLKAQAGPLTANLGISSSAENGLTITPNVKLGLKLGEDGDNKDNKLGFNIGTAVNSRAGVKQLTYGVALEQVKYQVDEVSKKRTGYSGTSINSDLGASGSFNLGMPTYTPQVSMPMQNVSISANFQFGGALFGAHPSGYIGASYNGQKLITTHQENPAYGYLNLDEGKNHDDGILDFNRENDGEFTRVTPNLPTTNLTFDYLSVSGQGVSGSYRPFRSEIGYVFDPASYSTTEGYNIGAEAGFGETVHAAGDFVVNTNYTNSGRWISDNLPTQNLRYGNKGSNPDHEKVYYKEANEKSVDSDPAYYDKFGSNYAARFKLNQLSKFNVRADNEFEFDEISNKPVPTVNYRQKRDKRNQVIYPLTHDELAAGFGLDALHLSAYAGTSASPIGHHTAEITTYNTDGMRYVYGIAAYNTVQKEVTFAAGHGLYNSDPGLVTGTGECASGLVTYNPGSSNSTSNPHGLDNFYSSTTTPAYAHSYLLTAVLSPDYVDADDTKGPSVGDLGYYTKFSYTRAFGSYKWRTPVEANKANYNEGLKSDNTDDKASYVYGEKEIWYLDKIESKNYIAVFETENRIDAYGVTGENGGIDATQPSKLLRSIKLYARKDYNDRIAASLAPIPIKTVHFEYDYSLCPGVPNNTNTVTPGVAVLDGSGNPTNGKLTLKRVYFTYQNSQKARLSPYDFKYPTTTNYTYNPKGYDRWGNYKSSTGNCGAVSDPLTAAEFPYVEQNQTTADSYSSAWCLNEIDLPSGGVINVTYESDDYAYVQNKRAMQMFKIVGFYNGSTPNVYSPLTTQSFPNRDNTRMIFELQPGMTDITRYTEGVDKVYFKCLMEVLPSQYDYVFGYAELSTDVGIVNISGTDYGYVKLKGVKFDDHDANNDKHPFIRTAIQFSRLHLSRQLYGDPIGGDAGSFGESLITGLLSATAFMSLFNNLSEAAQGPNDYAYSHFNVGKGIVMGKSWMRLNNPNHKKLGGGCRVKEITMSDAWADMGGSSSMSYGQDYTYTLDDGTSSGIAAYEPQLGGEENPFKQPITYDIKNAMAPDTKMYQEEPLGESFFPSPHVGYSKVTVKNLSRTGVTKHATGKVVHEFYTTKDFPTIAHRTAVNAIPEQQDPLSIASLLNVRSRSYLTATQGFSIEVNDMDGKPKKQSVYQEGVATPITSVEYKYQCSPYGNGSFVLNNSVLALSPDGTQSTVTVGQFFDMAADMREETSFAESTKLMANLDVFLIGPLPIGIPTFWPALSSEETQFRSATTTKVIQRFGILQETVATDLGSMVSTKNLAYDSETGDVLVTQTKTDFNDAVYTLTYPAHWFYDKGLGHAYKNIGLSIGGLNFSGTGTATYAHAADYFVPGDELELSNGVRAWVVDVQANSLRAMKKDGSAVSGVLSVKVIRSGRKNMPAIPISSITTLVNPLTNFKSNVFSNVLQASAVEYSDEWRTFCDCFGITGTSTSVNPYVMGSKGNWRAKRSLLHLSPRTQSNYNNNTNTRKDGVFTSFNPYYKLSGGKWQIDEKDWTFTSEVTEFSPFGQELENKDALGRYSAATFGYRQTFATSVAANAKYKDIGSDNFEDYDFSPCADNHFKFTSFTSNIDTTRSHSGRKSMKVASGVPVKMNKTLTVCDPVGCNLSLSTVSFPSLNKDVYTVLNGSGPYNIEYNIIYGTPEVNLQADGFTLVGTAYKVEVTITDAKGCKLYQIVTKP